MNLIEDLGGYANSKGVLEAYKKSGWSISDVCKGFHQYFTIEDLEKAILQYRREHRIFEVGDKAVYKGEAGLDGLFEIETLTKTGKPKTVRANRFGNFPCRYCEVQHATDEEIKAGHRL